MKSQAKKIVPSPLTLAAGRALRRAAKVARKTARVHGTPIYVWKDGKVVAEWHGAKPAFRRELNARLRLNASSWIAARCKSRCPRIPQ